MDFVTILIILLPFLFFMKLALDGLAKPITVFRDNEGNIIVRKGDKVAWEAEGEHCEGVILEITGEIALVDLYVGYKKFGDRKTLRL